MAMILQAERNDLSEQVKNATSTTSQRQPGVVDTRVIGRPDEEPMKHGDRLFKLRSNLGAVDQRYQTESKTTEASSTPRLDATLSTQMYCTLVMTKTLYKCHNAGMTEGSMEAVRDGMGAKVCWTLFLLRTSKSHRDAQSSAPSPQIFVHTHTQMTWRKTACKTIQLQC